MPYIIATSACTVENGWCDLVIVELLLSIEYPYLIITSHIGKLALFRPRMKLVGKYFLDMKIAIPLYIVTVIFFFGHFLFPRKGWYSFAKIEKDTLCIS